MSHSAPNLLVILGPTASGKTRLGVEAARALNGEIIGGMWVVAGQAYNSPSAALNSNVRTRDGNPVNLNGWRHWEVLVPGRSSWVRLNRLDSGSE